jgi:hypothetical protein
MEAARVQPVDAEIKSGSAAASKPSAVAQDPTTL